MLVLGIHKDPWHNTGAALIRGERGRSEFVLISEERLDRVKDSRAYPEKSISVCLREFGVPHLEEVDLIVLDYIRDRNWRLDHFKTPCRQATALDTLSPSKIQVVNHHLAHAYAVFYSSGFDSAAVLVVDGRGSDKETQSLFFADRSGIELIARTTSIGIGLLYAAVTQAIGFGLLQEGKTMGLAPFGASVNEHIFRFEPRYEGVVTDYSDICTDGSYDLKVAHPPFDTFEKKARAAYEVQLECESAMLHLARWAHQTTKSNNLCISGGVALNSVANFKIHRSGLFKNLFINPAASDTGIPLGAALYGYHKILGASQDYSLIPPFLGPSYSIEAIELALNAFSGYEIVREDPIGEAAELLAENFIVGCHYGRSEMGPRALGNRSILMSPLRAENKDILNSRVKHREAFRPFAPAIHAHRATEYFEIDTPSPYMLLVPPVRLEKQSVIPAVTHVDGTGRLQTVTRDMNPLLYRLVELFEQRTGVPVLLNTSFNINNEPIVETPEDAIRCFLGTNIDALLINGTVLLVKKGAV